MTSVSEELWSGFQFLTPFQQRVVFLSYWYGMTEVEIGEELGWSQPSIHRAIQKSIDRIRKRLELNDPQNNPLYVRGEKGSRPKHKVAANERTGLMPSRPHSPSIKFTPDSMYGSPERGEVLDAIFEIHWYPYIECINSHPLRGEYMDKLANNRAMVAAGACWDEEYLRNAA